MFTSAELGEQHGPMCTENLNPNVVMMKSAEDGV